MRGQGVLTLATLTPLVAVSLVDGASTPVLAAQEAVVFDSADVAGLSFQSIGPPRGGRSTAVAGITEQPLTYFMGATGGGVWRYRAGRGAEPARGCAPDAAGAALTRPRLGRERCARTRRRRRRTGPVWRGLALLFVATLAWGCVGDGIVQPSIEQPDPRFLTVQAIPPASNRDVRAMVVVEGPALDSLRSPALELFELNTSSSTRRQIIVSGELSAGPVLELRVPDGGSHAQCRVRLLQVAGEDYTLRDLAAYSAVVSR